MTKKPKLEEEIVRSDKFDKRFFGTTGMGHQRKAKGLSSFDAMYYTLDDGDESLSQVLPDSAFSDLIGCELSSSIYGCIWSLSKTKYLLSNPKVTIKPKGILDIIEVTEWLAKDVTDTNGDLLFKPLLEDGENLQVEVEDGEPIPALGIAASLIVHDLCEQGELFSVNWYLAKILQEYFWHATNRENQIFLIGMLWEQFGQKEKNESAVLRGEAAFDADKKRGAKGGSDKRKQQRLESLLSNMESLTAENPILKRLDPIQCGKEALKLAVEERPDVWRQGQGQLANYLVELASFEPYKKRFDKIFFC